MTKGPDTIGIDNTELEKFMEKAQEERSIINAEEDKGNILEKVKKKGEQALIALGIKEKKTIYTAQRFSPPDESGIMERAFPDFDQNCDYFDAIRDKDEKATIDELAKEAHPFFAQYPYKAFRNVMAWCWVKLRNDIADVAEKYNMNKLGPGATIKPDRLKNLYVIGWTHNGSLIFLAPNTQGDNIDVHYEAIPIRETFLSGETSLKPSETYKLEEVLSPVKVGYAVRAQVITSPLRAVYWSPAKTPEISISIVQDLREVKDTFTHRTQISRSLISPEDDKEKK